MELVETVLKVGRENAIHNDELAKLLGVTPSCAKSMIRKARLHGADILSDARGYWLAENDQERTKFINSMYKQAISRFRAVSGVKRIVAVTDGQMDVMDELKAYTDGE